MAAGAKDPKHLATERPVSTRRVARKENWLQQLQGALLDLLTCRDAGDEDRRADERQWWVCAEGFESVCDGGAAESPNYRRQRGSSLDVGFLEVGAAPEWTGMELPRELTDKSVPPGLGSATPRPVPPPVQPGLRKSTAEPQPPRAARISTSRAEASQPPVAPQPSPASVAPAPQPGPSRVTERPVRPLMAGKRLGPAALSTAVPAKLGDVPAPSFQVIKTTGHYAAQRAEPLSVSGVSTTSGSASLPGVGGAGGMTLNVLLQGDRWVALPFTRVDDLDRRAADFVQEQRLSSLIKSGLAHQLRQMVAMRQLSASVDVVDLL